MLIRVALEPRYSFPRKKLISKIITKITVPVHSAGFLALEHSPVFQCVLGETFAPVFVSSFAGPSPPASYFSHFLNVLF